MPFIPGISNVSDACDIGAYEFDHVDLVMSITESADPVIVGGGNATLIYTVTVTNAGPAIASGVGFCGRATITGLNETDTDNTNDSATQCTSVLKGGTTFVVNTLDDVDDGACTLGHCSLRVAVSAANAIPGDDTISFAANVRGTINLTGPLPNLSTTLAINGPGAKLLTVRRDTGVSSASSSYRIPLRTSSSQG